VVAFSRRARLVPGWKNREGTIMALIRRLLEMIRFSHTLFALPFALMSAALAWREEPFRWIDLVGILVCMIFARSAAMAFNRLVDREIDAKNPRTQNRHLPAGTLSFNAVLVFFVVCSAGFIGGAAIFTLRQPPNCWPIDLAAPVLLFICAYSLTKRFTALAHFWLGASLMLAPLAAWIAIRGLVDLETPLVLGGAVLFWVAGFDILYACQDVEFDRQAKLASIPAKFGVKASLGIALICHVVMMGLLVALSFVNPRLGNIYLTGLAAIGVLLVYEHWLVQPDDLTRVNRAFFQVNGVISLGLLALALVQLALS
jgi:4-hydroxybenzoate polyprenyltransferase